jgi:hypothetical protein
MEVFIVRNVNHAVSEVLPFLLAHGERDESRNGPVLVAPAPVATVYTAPQERVLFSPLRDANPFFHLMESLWMLAGRDDVAFPLFFNSRFGEYSDDGVTVHGAYGYRWRKWFDFDQLRTIADELKANPKSRRCVLGMWDPRGDLGVASRDLPCNTHIYFDCRNGLLNMTVCNRSNDAIWGAYGANAVHMSVLQEVMAMWIGVPMGVYRQVSNNFHAYTDKFDEHHLAKIADNARFTDYYSTQFTEASRVISVRQDNWFADLERFLHNPKDDGRYWDPFFNETAVPLYAAWEERKLKIGSGIELAREIAAPDWRIACVNWINRRKEV